MNAQLEKIKTDIKQIKESGYANAFLKYDSTGQLIP